MNKFLIKITLIVTLFVSMTCHATVLATYEDISNHWAEETIVKFAEKGYLHSGDIEFLPDTEITKGELATIVNRYFSYGSAENEAENLKIAAVNGYLFNSDVSDKITREEVAIVVCKVLSLSPIDERTLFLDDQDISIWSIGYVRALEKKGIMVGYPNQTYIPQKNITKAEFVTVLNRCIGIGGTDLEIIETENNKLEVGTFSIENGEIKFIPIEEQISLKVGEEVQIALKLPQEVENNEIEFGITSEEIVVFDKETYLLSALRKGKAEMNIRIQEQNTKIKVFVE